MIKNSTQALGANTYFAEIHPFIHKRLMPIMLIIAGAMLFAAGIGLFFVMQIPRYSIPEGAYWIQWFTIVTLIGTVIAMGFGALQLRKNKVHQAITILLVGGAISIIAQCIANGGMGEASIIAYPGIIMIAGFFGNLIIMSRIKHLLVASVIALYLLGLFGIKPPDISEQDPTEVFMRIDQLIYCLLILEVCFRAVKMFINDYGVILSRAKNDQKKLQYVANHDALTGLPNRYACDKIFEELFHNATHHADTCQLLLFIDIDNFKNINTRFGHNGGDEALKKVVSRLKQVFSKEAGVVCRIGSDEFIVMLNISSNQVGVCLDRVLSSLSKSFTVVDQKQYITCSIGVVEIESSNSSFRDEYHKADMAMNRAKSMGKNRYCYYSQTFSDITLKNIEMGISLYEALQREEFILYYQPQVDLVTGSIVGAEALIRWKTKDGLILPGDFIPIAEKNGSILAMTEWIVRQSCKDCANWHANGYTDLFVSINVPSMVLAEGGLPNIIREACDEVGLSSRFLEVELTESVLLENKNDIKKQLQDIRDMGISLAIDDFGTGYSNLSYLSHLNVQKLKVDKYFVMNLMKSHHNKDIIQAVVHIANSFGMKTVAEGVENHKAAKALQGLDCTIGQGYLWSKPEPLDVFMGVLRQRDLMTQLSV